MCPSRIVRWAVPILSCARLLCLFRTEQQKTALNLKSREQTLLRPAAASLCLPSFTWYNTKIHLVPKTTWEEHKNCQQAEPGQKTRHTPKKLEYRFPLVFKCLYVAVLLVSGANPRSPPFPPDGTLELPCHVTLEPRRLTFDEGGLQSLSSCCVCWVQTF